MRSILYKSIINFLIIFIIEINIYSITKEYKKAYENYLDRNYKKAIFLFKKIVKKKDNPKALYYLGLSYYHLKKYKDAKEAFLAARNLDSEIKFINKDKYFTVLKLIHDSILEEKLINSMNQKYFYIILGILIILLLFILLFLFYKIFFQKRVNKRRYKNISINSYLVNSLEKLNFELSQAKKIIFDQNKQNNKKKIQFSFNEIEQRCIFLNDKLEQLKYGLKSIDKQYLENEIELTRELIRNCMKKI